VMGDLIADETGRRSIDANHLAPWVGLPGKRTSGDCIEGGTFHSFFRIRG
jgi:hypothetical protein